MASLYKRSSSPYWYVQYRDPHTGKVQREATRWRVASPRETLAAREHCEERSLREGGPGGGCCRGWRWVSCYLRSDPPTPELRVWRVAVWESLARFLRECRINYPNQFTADDCAAYVTWRTDPGKQPEPVTRETARAELGLLATIMREAIRRELIDHNPCEEPPPEADASGPTPQLNTENLAVIRTAISSIRREAQRGGDSEAVEFAHFLHVSFEIAINQDCPVTATCLDLRRDVFMERCTLVRLPDQNDGCRLVRLAPALIPLFQELRNAGRTMTYDYAAEAPRRRLSVWRTFLKSLNLRHLYAGGRIGRRLTLKEKRAFLDQSAAGQGSGTVTPPELAQRPERPPPAAAAGDPRGRLPAPSRP